MRPRTIVFVAAVVALAAAGGVLAGRASRPVLVPAAKSPGNGLPLVVVHGEEPLRGVRPRSCEIVTDSRGKRAVRVRGDVVVNDGPDALIVGAELRVLGDGGAWSGRSEWRVPVGESIADVEFPDDGPEPLPRNPNRCFFFIESATTYVPPATGPPPHGAGATIGVEYEYVIGTHCGLTRLEFNGRWWDVSPPVSDDPHNKPPGWDDPARGVIVLLTPNRAEFRAGGRVARLVPGPAPTALGECY